MQTTSAPSAVAPERAMVRYRGHAPARGMAGLASSDAPRAGARLAREKLTSPTVTLMAAATNVAVAPSPTI